MSEHRLTHRRILKRVRRPRVHLTYETELYGARQTCSLPFTVGVLANFCGDRAARVPLKERQFIEIDVDNFASVMSSLQPAVAIETEREDRLEIQFTSIRDFSAESLVSRVPVLRDMMGLRSRLLSRPPSDHEYAVAPLREQGLIDSLSADSPDAAINAIDRQITDMLRGIIRHPGFRSLESTWTALWYLVVQTETGESLRIEILDITKDELIRDFHKAPDAEKTFIFKRVYEDRYGKFGANSFGVLVGDYWFSHEPQDIRLIRDMAGVAAATHAPFVAAVSARMFNLDNYSDLVSIRDVSKVFQTPEYAAWNAFRDSEDARWVALTLPEMLLRSAVRYRSPGLQPYVFDDDGLAAAGLLWGNAAFALAACMTRAFARESWLSDIQGVDGGRVENLPLTAIALSDGSLLKLCTSLRINDRLELALSRLGFAALSQSAEGDEAAFFSVPSCQRARNYDSAEATGNARILTRLPAVLVCARFAQYLQAISRDRIGSFKERADYERYLNQWLSRYVSHQPADTAEQRAQYPLREGAVSVVEMPDSPGAYLAMLYLRPQYGLDGLTVSLRVPVRLPLTLSS